MFYFKTLTILLSVVEVFRSFKEATLHCEHELKSYIQKYVSIISTIYIKEKEKKKEKYSFLVKC